MRMGSFVHVYVHTTERPDRAERVLCSVISRAGRIGSDAAPAVRTAVAQWQSSARRGSEASEAWSRAPSTVAVQNSGTVFYAFTGRL